MNGFYAAMKTNNGVKAVFIDEEAFRREVEREHRKQLRQEQQAEKVARDKGHRRWVRATKHLLKQELKLLGMGMVLWLGQRAGLVDMAFSAPVLIGFQTVICFRAGRYWGRWGKKLRRVRM